MPGLSNNDHVGRESFAQRLRRLRQQSKKSQNALAREVGAAKNTVVNWETEGSSLPSERYLQALASVFDVTRDYLVTGVDWERMGHGESLEDYLRRTTSLAPDQIAHMSRQLEAFQAERELRELRAQLEAQGTSLHSAAHVREGAGQVNGNQGQSHGGDPDDGDLAAFDEQDLADAARRDVDEPEPEI